jgi:hypothetical protein
MGDWVAIWDGAHPTGKWQLYHIVNDPAQNNNVADQNPALLQKMIAAYQNYSKDVGIVIPRGAIFAFQASHLTPSLSQSQTIQMYGVLPQELATYTLEIILTSRLRFDKAKKLNSVIFTSKKSER